MFSGSKIPSCLKSPATEYRRRWVFLALSLVVILVSTPNFAEAKKPGSHPPLQKNVTVVFGNDTRLFIPHSPPSPCGEDAVAPHYKCPPHSLGPKHHLNENVTAISPPEAPKTSSIETSSRASTSTGTTSTSDISIGNPNPPTMSKTAIIGAASLGGIAALLGLVGYSFRGRRQALFSEPGNQSIYVGDDGEIEVSA